MRMNFRKIIKLSIIGLFFFGGVMAPTAVRAETYYISPNGNDANDALSLSSPIQTFVHAHNLMVGGDTLILMDGTYAEQLYPPSEDSGSTGTPTIFRAQNMGQAVIAPTTLRVDQETSGSLFVYSTNSATSHDFVFDGLMVEGTGEHAAISIRSADNVTSQTMTYNIAVKNCGAFGSAIDSNNAGSTISLTKNSLLEDCFFFGFGRYALSNYATHGVTLRRIILRFDWWEGDSYKPNDPRDGIAFYNVENGIGENIIVMDMGGRPNSAHSGDMNAITVGGNDTGLAITGTSNTELLGSILYNNYDQRYGSVNGLMLNGGSGAAGTPASPGDTHDVTINDLVVSNIDSYGVYVYNNIVNVDIDNLTAMHAFTGLQVNSSPQNNVEGITIDNSFGTNNSNRGIVWDVNDTTPTNISVTNCSNQSNIEAAYAPTVNYIPTNTPVVGHERGADVTKRYVDGVKTNIDLWPWSNQNLIKDKMCSNIYLQKISDAINAKEGTNISYLPGLCATSKTITDYIWSALGNNCPSNVCSSANDTRADVDQNSTINSTDAMLTLRNSLSLDMSSTNWQASATTGDANCDSSSNSTDAMLILRQSLGLDMTGTGWCVS